MFSWALLNKELTELANRRQTYILRAVYVAGIFAIYTSVFYGITAHAPLGGIGKGKQLFETTLGLQWAAILLILPALASNLIVDERDRKTLELLMVTRLGLGSIISQKFISRLIVIITLLMATQPLHAFSFRSGGVETVQMLKATQVQIGACFLVNALSICVSATARTATGAMTIAYGLAALCGILIASFYPFANGMFFLALQTTLAITALLWGMKASRKSPRKYRSFLWKKSSGERLFVPGLALADQMGNAPIAWRDHRRMGLNCSWIQRNLLTLEMAMALLFLLLIAVGESSQTGFLLWDRQPIIFFWYFVVARLTVLTVNTIARERMDQTIDPLLTTDLDGFQILYQKMLALHAYVKSLWVPFAVYYLGRTWIMGFFSDIDFSLFIIPYLVLGAVCVWIYLPLFMWLAMWIGLKVPSRNKAILITLGIILVGSDILHGIVNILVQMLGLGGYLIAVPAMLSPIAFIRRIEYFVFYHSLSGVLSSIATIIMSSIAFFLYAKLSHFLMKHCTGRADEMLRSHDH